MVDVQAPTTPGQEIEQTRMSFGDHLEELRSRLIRALIGLALGAVVSLIFSRAILVVLLRPLLVVLDAHGLRPSLMAMGVADPFVNYLKIGLLCGLILAMPWIIYQIWLFVASGLYSHERHFVQLFGPLSTVLFAAGVAFMYFIVLPIVLNFFITFNQSFGMPSLERSALARLLLGDEEQPLAPPATDDWPSLPVVDADPDDPPAGLVWVNSNQRRLKVQTDRGLLTLPLEAADTAAAVRSEFGLKFYISFVLGLALAFGLAFELPIAVMFLSATNLVPARAMAKGRRHVIFAIFVATALLTPPDVISQVLLAIPMIALFEGGLLAARLIERRRDQQNATAEETVTPDEAED